MSEKEKVTKNAILEELHREKYITIAGGDTDAFIPECDYSNATKDLNKTLENLYYFANGKTPNKTERDIELDDFTKALIVTIMSMEGTKRDSFVYCIRHRQFDKVTVEQKLDFLRRVYQQLIRLKEVPTEEYLKDYYQYRDLSENANYDELYRKDMIELLDEKLYAIVDDLYIADYVKIIENEVSGIINGVVETIYPYNLLGGLLYPKEYSANTMNDVFECLESNEVFSKPELSLLDYEEKKQLLDVLKDKISDCVDDWKEMVCKVFEGKIEDSSLLIEEILIDYIK